MKRAVSAISKVLLLIMVAGTLMGGDSDCDIEVRDGQISIDGDNDSSDEFEDWVDSLFD